MGIWCQKLAQIDFDTSPIFNENNVAFYQSYMGGKLWNKFLNALYCGLKESMIKQWLLNVF